MSISKTKDQMAEEVFLRLIANDRMWVAGEKTHLENNYRAMASAALVAAEVWSEVIHKSPRT